MSEGKRPSTRAGCCDFCDYIIPLEAALVAALERYGCECRTRGTMCDPCYERKKLTDAAYALIPAPQKEPR